MFSETLVPKGGHFDSPPLPLPANSKTKDATATKLCTVQWYVIVMVRYISTKHQQLDFPNCSIVCSCCSIVCFIIKKKVKNGQNSHASFAKHQVRNFPCSSTMSLMQ